MAQNPFGALSNNDFISQLLGTAPDYSESIGAAQQKRLVDNAQQQAMLNGVVALLGLSGPQRQQVGTGQALGAALGAGIGGYNESMDRTLKQALTGMQLQEYTAKRAREEAMRKGMASAITSTPQLTPMATGPRSQLGMLNLPEFGGDMAVPETIGALMSNPNLPQVKTVNRDQLLATLAEYDPVKYIESTAKTDAGTSDMKNYQFAQTPQGGNFKGTFPEWQTMSKQAGAIKLSVNTSDPTAVAKAGMDVLKQYSDLTKDSRERAARWNSIVAASKDPNNPATDATLIYSTAKILDPTGAVQQGDLKTIIGNPSIPQRVQTMARTLYRGGTLSTDQRSDLIANAYSIIQADQKNIEPTVNTYKDFASSFKVDTNKIESPYKNLQKPMTITVPIGNKRATANLAKDGKYYVNSGGKYYEVSEE